MGAGQASLRSDLQRVERLSDADPACLYNLAGSKTRAADFGKSEPERGGRQLARRLRGAGLVALGVGRAGGGEGGLLFSRGLNRAYGDHHRN